MNKSKIEKRLPEPQPNSSAKVEVTTSCPAIAKPHVVRSPLSNAVLSQDDANEKSVAIIKILNGVSHLQSQQILSSVKNLLDSISIVKEENYSQLFSIESKVAKS